MCAVRCHTASSTLFTLSRWTPVGHLARYRCCLCGSGHLTQAHRYNESMEATIKVVSSINDISECCVNGHCFEFGGPGDGFCYEHQSFDCLENLSPEEREAVDRAEYQVE